MAPLHIINKYIMILMNACYVYFEDEKSYFLILLIQETPLQYPNLKERIFTNFGTMLNPGIIVCFKPRKL